MNINNKLQSSNPIFDHGVEFLPTNLTHRDVLTKYEKVPTYIFPESYDASVSVAKEIAIKTNNQIQSIKGDFLTNVF